MTRMLRNLAPIGVGLVLCMGTAALPAAADAADTVLQVVAVRVNPGQLDTYLGKIKQLNAMMQRLGVPATMRAWQATLAGDATGTVVVALEHANLAAFAEATTKIQGDAEWQKLVGELGEIRTIVSTALYAEVTP